MAAGTADAETPRHEDAATDGVGRRSRDGRGRNAEKRRRGDGGRNGRRPRRPRHGGRGDGRLGRRSRDGRGRNAEKRRRGDGRRLCFHAPLLGCYRCDCSAPAPRVSVSPCLRVSASSHDGARRSIARGSSNPAGSVSASPASPYLRVSVSPRLAASSASRSLPTLLVLRWWATAGFQGKKAAKFFLVGSLIHIPLLYNNLWTGCEGRRSCALFKFTECYGMCYRILWPLGGIAEADFP